MEHCFCLTLLENHQGRQMERLLKAPSQSDMQRWLAAFPNPDDPTNQQEEVVYEDWDCPQVTCVEQYEATQADELNLERTEIINVIRKSNGWYEGIRLSDGQKGWFPEANVLEITNEHVRRRNLRERYRTTTSGRAVAESNREGQLLLLMQAARCPTDELSLTNCAVVNEKDFSSGQHLTIKTTPTMKFVFTVKTHPSVVPGSIAFSLPQRKWAGLSLNQDVEVAVYNFDPSRQYVGTMTVEIDFLQKKSIDSNPYDSDKMAIEFIQYFTAQAFSMGQQLVFSYCDKLFGLVIKDIEAMDPSILRGEQGSSKKQKIEIGLLHGNSQASQKQKALGSLSSTLTGTLSAWALEA
ncbi:hypothetical protein DNTS_004270 [Danionella cerebrum]|uniref:SH3 domain-containing protein n=1 Tax=Danionella cerebrum TaxID=2873325 RepID=A0A553MS84_9TELE|nr:hypothetical protein DNTS_004270 [Danionella translucida]